MLFKYSTLSTVKGVDKNVIPVFLHSSANSANAGYGNVKSRHISSWLPSEPVLFF